MTHDLLILAGAVLIATALWLVFPPLAFMAVGAFCIAIGLGGYFRQQRNEGKAKRPARPQRGREIAMHAQPVRSPRDQDERRQRLRGSV